MCWKRWPRAASMSAANSRAISSCRISPPPATGAAHLFEPLPQVLENVRFKKGSPLDDEKVKSSIESANARLGASGRVLVRKSGTEPLIRVRAEGEDTKVVRAVVRQIASAIEEVGA